MDRLELEKLVEIEDRKITVTDARLHFGGCIPGWKTFSEANGFDWIDVVRHGLYSSQLLSTNDAMADSLVSYIYTKDNQ